AADASTAWLASCASSTTSASAIAWALRIVAASNCWSSARAAGDTVLGKTTSRGESSIGSTPHRVRGWTYCDLRRGRSGVNRHPLSVLQRHVGEIKCSRRRDRALVRSPSAHEKGKLLILPHTAKMCKFVR